MKLGDTIWLFNENKRVYKDGHSGPVYREHFEAHTIVAENRASWILDNEDGMKIDKRTELLRQPERGGWYGRSCYVYATQQAVDDACYVREMRATLSRLILNCTDVNIIRAVENCFREALGEHWMNR